ncbi:MAG TPA: flagellin [Hyphomicrobiaceae bacterium]|nr:flagellin [Hyphomicrobiaceae bacterium]
MSSIITNIAAMTALQTLNRTNAEMLVTQNRISTGLRVSTAADNAAYWSIATTMRSDNMALSTVQDALGLGGGTVDIAIAGLNTAIDVASKIKMKLVAARAPGIDRGKIQSEITQLQSSLQNTVDAASFSGENWLSVDSTGNTTKSVVASLSRDSTGVLSIATISVDVGPTGSMLVDSSGSGAGILDQTRTVTSGGTYTILTIDVSALTDAAADLTDLEDYIDGVDTAIASMTDAGTVLGAAKSRIDVQQGFVARLMDAIDTGIGQLVDADMNQESTRLQALQVRQQLGVQALSIANQSAQMILQLFRQ